MLEQLVFQVSACIDWKPRCRVSGQQTPVSYKRVVQETSMYIELGVVVRK
jgi:hypothetical protein